MPTIFDFLYREYCRARLAEMRKQLLISPKKHEVPDAFRDAKVDGGVSFCDTSDPLPYASSLGGIRCCSMSLRCLGFSRPATVFAPGCRPDGGKP